MRAIHFPSGFSTLALASVSGAANGDGKLSPLKPIIGDLPEGMLYISAGSTCNVCNESNPENATLRRATPDGTMAMRPEPPRQGGAAVARAARGWHLRRDPALGGQEGIQGHCRHL